MFYIIKFNSVNLEHYPYILFLYDSKGCLIVLRSYQPILGHLKPENLFDGKIFSDNNYLVIHVVLIYPKLKRKDGFLPLPKVLIFFAQVNMTNAI